MTLYNVAATVVALVEADSPEEARSILGRELESHGLVEYDDQGRLDVVECEDQGTDRDLPRRTWR